MSDSMNLMDFHSCLQALQNTPNWRSPHNVILHNVFSAATAYNVDTGEVFDSDWDFNATPLTEAKWNTISWPNALFRSAIRYDKKWGGGETYTKALLTPDPAASPKPTWAELKSALTDFLKKIELDERRMGLRGYVRERINKQVYRANDFDDEIFNRLNDGETAEQIAERKRLLAKHKEIRATLANKTLAELKAFNPESDALWAKE